MHGVATIYFINAFVALNTYQSNSTFDKRMLMFCA